MIGPADVPLLRSPPFPGADAAVSRASACGVQGKLSAAHITALFDAIRTARVGGAYWSPPAEPIAAQLVRITSADDVDRVAKMLDRDAPAQWLLPPDSAHTAAIVARTGHAAASPFSPDPWSLLGAGTTLFAHGDDEWLALGVIAGSAVHILSTGRFGAPGDDKAGLQQRIAADLLRCAYRNPFDGYAATIDATIAQLADWRRILDENRKIVAACGFSWWKRREISRLLWSPEQALRFFQSEHRAISFAARTGGSVAIWPSRTSKAMTNAAAAQGVKLIRVEDGFVRSVGLGSDLVPPSSVIVDHQGIHYDPARASHLEMLLAETDFSPALRARARDLHALILKAGVSKYGGDGAHCPPLRPTGRRLVLVPGQVEDDLSVLLGGAGMTSNLDLLRRTRALEPDAEIWFRPHPDVDAGHRRGAVRDTDALGHADRVVRGSGMAGLLDLVDAVHVLTSLTGFEALLRGREVICHGSPFYAGWGLTRDLAPAVARRGRRLALDELIAAVLILYPRYLDPVSGIPCPPEILIGRIGDGTARNRLKWVSRLRRLQGRLRSALA